MKLLRSIISMIDVSHIKFKKKEKKPSIVKDIIDEPDSYKLEAFVENGEVVIKIRKREEIES